jgi:hypothetical protein
MTEQTHNQKQSTQRYTMLDNLKTVLDEIDNEWALTFVEDLLIRREENRLDRLTDKQFKKLVEIHDKYYARIQ